jgi:hypothetical protein
MTSFSSILPLHTHATHSRDTRRASWNPVTCARRASICGCDQHAQLILTNYNPKEYEEITNCLSNTELLLLIMSFLEAEDLRRCAKVCSFWNLICDDHTLWRQLCAKADYPIDTNSYKCPDWASSWKEVYRWFYECRTHVFQENETRNGRGSFTWANGCKYYGEWKDNKEHGRGYKIWTDGATFEGEWKNAKFNGRGRHTWASGSTYEGMWVDHKRNGWGCNTWSQKDSYIGEWLDDEKNGYGTYIWSDCRRYDGTWKNDKRSGKGTFVWPTLGCKYDGEWQEDKRHGHGRFYWKDGDIYEGEWKDGRRCGKGKLFTASGQVYHQEWDEKEDFDSANKGDLSKPEELPPPPPPANNSENNNNNNNNNTHRSFRRGSVAFVEGSTECEQGARNGPNSNCHKRKAAELNPPPFPEAPDYSIAPSNSTSPSASSTNTNGNSVKNVRPRRQSVN